MDAEVRELERRFRASGALDDEAAWLLARVRAGSLAEQRLHLASYLRDHAAVLAAGGAYFDDPFSSNPTFKEIKRYGKETCVRIAVASARAALAAERYHRRRWPEDETYHTYALEPWDECVAAAEAWVLCPCRRHQEGARVWVERSRPRGADWAALAAIEAARAVWRRPVQSARWAHAHAGSTGNWERPRAFAHEVITWALGYADQVAARSRGLSSPWLVVPATARVLASRFPEL